MVEGQITTLQYLLFTVQVRKVNYDRRKDQINNQGFVSLKQKPYKAIGHPVYLDNRKLITEALGLPQQVGKLIYRKNCAMQMYRSCCLEQELSVYHYEVGVTTMSKAQQDQKG